MRLNPIGFSLILYAATQCEAAETCLSENGSDRGKRSVLK